MKPFFFFLLAAAMAVMTNNTFSQKAADETIQIKTSARCGMCKKTLETQLPRYGGVSKVSLNVETKMLTVAYNPGKTNPDKIRKAVNDIGYDADDKIAPDANQKRLKPCCRKDAPEHKD
jgi:copper chaperone CopZ